MSGRGIGAVATVATVDAGEKGTVGTVDPAAMATIGTLDAGGDAGRVDVWKVE